jgi:hypothetical protein
MCDNNKTHDGVDCTKAIHALEESFWYVVGMAVLWFRWKKDATTGLKCVIKKDGAYLGVIVDDYYLFHRKALTDAFVYVNPGLGDFSEMENYIELFRHLSAIGAIEPRTHTIAFNGIPCEYIQISKKKLNKGIKPFRAELKPSHSA